jgi:phosphotriesterase-related protein
MVTEGDPHPTPAPGRSTGRVQAVLGPIDPADLGWVLPHEHTAIALWHIPNRWDYWELRRDEPVILEELAAFRAVGGGALVDVTLDGVGRDPEWLAGLARSSGLTIVMGGGWYRGAHYPAETMIDRRSVDALAEVIVGEATDGVAGTGIRIGIIGEIGTDRPWLSALEERVHRAAARAARRTGLAITTHAVQSTVGLDQLDLFEAEGADLTRVVIGHADSNPSLAYHRAIVERGATVEFDFLGMSFTPLERHGEGVQHLAFSCGGVAYAERLRYFADRGFETIQSGLYMGRVRFNYFATEADARTIFEVFDVPPDFVFPAPEVWVPGPPPAQQLMARALHRMTPNPASFGNR